MAYVAGDIISASDLNGFISVIDNVWGIGYATRGYGQGNLFSPVSVGAIINGTNWSEILPRITTLGLHQSNNAHPGIPLSSSFSSGELIEALDEGAPTRDLPGAITSIDTNRLNAHSTALTNFTGITSSRNTAWGSGAPQIIHEVELDFGSLDKARYFFNSGGKINFTAFRSGGSVNAQNTAWTNLLASIGIVTFNYATTTTSGTGTGSAIGYYTLDTYYKRIFMVSAGAYGVHDYAIYAKTNATNGVNGSNGGVVTFRVEFINGDATSVDGLIGSNVNFIKATTYLTVSSPAFNNLVTLSA